MNLDGFIHAIDGVDFARRRLGFDPDAKQSLVLAKRAQTDPSRLAVGSIKPTTPGCAKSARATR